VCYTFLRLPPWHPWSLYICKQVLTSHCTRLYTRARYPCKDTTEDALPKHNVCCIHGVQATR
jgi:hypothetical protein